MKKDNYENRLKELNEELENYQKEKEQRDTNAVRNFAKSSLFNKVRNMG